MAFYSGIRCDECGTAFESEGFNADEVLSISWLKHSARREGWSVGKDKLLCPKCRKLKKTDSAKSI